MNKAKAMFGLVLALIAIGAALAMWSETLMLNVNVNTGEVKVKFSDWYCTDTGPDPQAPGFHNEEGKNVAECNISVEETDSEGNAIKLLVNIGNAYPGYSVDVGLVIDNIGTIPVKLLNSSISEYDTSALSVSLSVPEDTQIDPGSNSTYTLHITVLQGAEELETYTFEVTLTFAQWNEVP